MSFNMRLKGDLVQLLNAGASITIDGGVRLTPDLVQLAAAARNSGATLTLRNMSMRLTPDLVQIANAGKGHVVFTD